MDKAIVVESLHHSCSFLCSITCISFRFSSDDLHCVVRHLHIQRCEFDLRDLHADHDIIEIFWDGKLRSLSFPFFKNCDVELTNDRKVFEPFFHRRVERSSVMEDASATHSQRGGVSFEGTVCGTLARR